MKSRYIASMAIYLTKNLRKIIYHKNPVIILIYNTIYDFLFKYSTDIVLE